MPPKEIKSRIKLQIMAGKANPAPPVGPALGQQGVNIMDFCKAFNEKTKGEGEVVIPVVLTVYKDRSFTFELKTPPTTFLIKKAVGIDKGSGEPNKKKVGKIKKEELKKIAQVKLKDLNTDDLEKAVKIIEGTAKNIGIKVEE